jgi:hypothetical protein
MSKFIQISDLTLNLAHVQAVQIVTKPCENQQFTEIGYDVYLGSGAVVKTEIVVVPADKVLEVWADVLAQFYQKPVENGENGEG